MSLTAQLILSVAWIALVVWALKIGRDRGRIEGRAEGFGTGVRVGANLLEVITEHDRDHVASQREAARWQ